MPLPRPTCLRALLLLALAGLVLGSCSEPEPPRRPPVLLVGVDGLEWDVLLPMLERGELPHLSRLMQDGSFGALETVNPTLSPVIWTSIATGKPAQEHGILAFSKNPVPGQPWELFSNADRRVKALWNIASEYERRVAVIGWWMTFPVEPVNGVMVAQTNSTSQLDTYYGKNIWKGGFVPGAPAQVYPSWYEDDIVAIADGQAARLDDHLGEVFGSFPHELSALGARLWTNTRWAFRSDSTYLAIAEDLLRSGDPFDLVCVYFGGADIVGHRFWRYYRPDLFAHQPSQRELDNLAAVIETYYRWVDGAVGRLRAAAPADARVLVVSDHGMQAVNRGQRFDPHDIPKIVNSGHHMTAPDGLILAAGADLRQAWSEPVGPLTRADVPRVASIYDVARTVLALLEIPAGADMRGRPIASILEPAFLSEHPPTEVPTHDTPEFLAGRAGLTATAQRANVDEMRQRLEALGYIGEDSVESDLRAGDPPR